MMFAMTLFPDITEQRNVAYSVRTLSRIICKPNAIDRHNFMSFSRNFFDQISIKLDSERTTFPVRTRLSGFSVTLSTLLIFSILFITTLELRA